MAYDDGYYYGQCKIVCEAETTVDNGKTVSISSTTGTFTASKSLSDKIAEFLVPGRDRYTVTLLDGTVTKWTGTIEAGYGECVHVMLADGYEPVIQKDYDAKMASLDAQLTTGTTPFRFGKTTDGRYGYIISSGGADSVIPFSNKATFTGNNFTAAKKYNHAYVVAAGATRQDDGSGYVYAQVWAQKNNVNLDVISGVARRTGVWGAGAYAVFDAGALNVGDVLKWGYNSNGAGEQYLSDGNVILIE